MSAAREAYATPDRYVMVAGDRKESCVTLGEAVEALLEACAADPGVTCMPHIVRMDGSALTEEEADTVDRLMDEAE